MILVNQQDVINNINEWIKSSEYYKDDKGIFLLQMVRDTIKKLPTQEIIHCKDCKHHWTHKCMDSVPIEICDLKQTFYDAEVDFCSLGKKRGETK